MKLYEVNQLIEGIFEQLVDPETGEVVENEALLAQLDSLQMERSRILEYLCKLVLNTRSQMAALKEEEKRLKERRASLERKDIRLMEILDRECGGEKTDCGVATVCYRKTTRSLFRNSCPGLRLESESPGHQWLSANCTLGVIET